MNYVTYGDMFDFILVIVSILSLVIAILSYSREKK